MMKEILDIKQRCNNCIHFVNCTEDCMYKYGNHFEPHPRLISEIRKKYAEKE